MQEEASGDQVETSTSYQSHSNTSRKRREDKKNVKKDTKVWENMVKTVSTMNETEKLEYFQENFVDLHGEMRNLNKTNAELTKQCTTIQKERDHFQSELGKSVIARARLENLCREMQKQNKEMKEENLTKIKEEELRRREVSNQFADKLNDINAMMDENRERSELLREENLRMTNTLSDLSAQFQARESDIAKMAKQLDLERQFSQATITKMELQVKAEKEIHMKEYALMKANLEKSEANCAVLMETVKGLQDHIDVYKNQYEDFENTMSKSTKVFDNYKFEMANMTKQVTKLEKEANSWRSKFQDSMRALVELNDLKKNLEGHNQNLDKKNYQLQKLCKQLQVDRANYLKLLKSHNIEITTPSVPEQKEPEETKTITQNIQKLSKKEKQLKQLKDSLQDMQNELNRLNLANEETKTEDQPNATTSHNDEATPKSVNLDNEVAQVVECLADHIDSNLSPKAESA